MENLYRQDGEELVNVDDIAFNFEEIDKYVGAIVGAELEVDPPILRSLIGLDNKGDVNYEGIDGTYRIYRLVAEDLPADNTPVGSSGVWDYQSSASFFRKDGPLNSFRIRLKRIGAPYGGNSSGTLNSITRAGEMLSGDIPSDFHTFDEKVTTTCGHAGGYGRSVSGYIDPETRRLWLVHLGPAAPVATNHYIEFVGRYLSL